MQLPDDIREFKPGRVFRPRDQRTLYWIRDDTVCFLDYAIRGADVASFRFYLGSFAKDCRNCYCTSSRLSGGNGATFRALNFCYASDGQNVWTMGGRIKDVDANSFVVCDDGYLTLGSDTRVPYGFGKDNSRVYYYDRAGKPKWVRRADPKSFQSLNDGYYGKDDSFVFCRVATLPGAKVEHWHRIGRGYSRDGRNVYCENRRISGADHDSFEVVRTEDGYPELAKDKNHFYMTDRVVDAAEFEALLAG